MAGPATNVSTMGMIKQEMGFRTLCLYLFSVITASIGFGYLLNYAVSALSLEGLIHMESQLHSHGANIQALYAACAILLAALMARLGVKKSMLGWHSVKKTIKTVVVNTKVIMVR